MPTLYETLGVNKNATPEEIRNAFRKLSLQKAPDKIQQRLGRSATPEETEEFRKIKEAYETLSDPQKKKESDELAGGSAQQWLDKNYPNQTSKYIILSNGERQPIGSFVNSATSLDDIKNKDLEGPLNLANFVNLRELDLTGNKITSLNVDNCPNLRVINCGNSPINSFKFLNGSKFVTEVRLSQGELLKSVEELSKQISVLEDNHRTQISKLKSEHSEEVKRAKGEIARELKQERSKNKNLEERLNERGNELQKLDRDLSTSKDQVTALTNKKNEL